MEVRSRSGSPTSGTSTPSSVRGSGALAARVPVHILYFTAVNDGLGGVRYLDDIYDRDVRVLRGLGEPPQVE